jgi:hypothetical protein
VHDLIASPFLDGYLVVRPGSPRGLEVAGRRYLEVCEAAAAGQVVPRWLADAVRGCWGMDVAGRPVRATVLVRGRSPFGYGRASYELNLGCMPLAALYRKAKAPLASYCQHTERR